MNHKKVRLIFLLLFSGLVFASAAFGLSYYFPALAIILYVLIAIRGSFDIGSNYHIRSYCSASTTFGKTISITFDDGPHPNTNKVLDVLARYNAKATFFCIGKNVLQFPEIMERIITEGHIVGNHTFNHSNWFDFYNRGRVLAEIRNTDAVLSGYVHRQIKYFRPPYGVTNPSIMKALKISGHYVIGWNIRSMDTVLKNENAIFDRITKKLKPGAVVLLHDRVPQTDAVVERLLSHLQDNNYKVVPLEDLISIPAYED